MLKKSLLFVTVFASIGCADPADHAQDHTKFPVLFRDNVYRSLSEQAKEVFYAVGIHPQCKAKNGQCIPRAKCTGAHMLYISRICYKHDLVCCYDNTIKHPAVARESRATSTPAPPPDADSTTERADADVGTEHAAGGAGTEPHTEAGTEPHTEAGTETGTEAATETSTENGNAEAVSEPPSDTTPPATP